MLVTSDTTAVPVVRAEDAEKEKETVVSVEDHPNHKVKQQDYTHITSKVVKGLSFKVWTKILPHSRVTLKTINISTAFNH